MNSYPPQLSVEHVAEILDTGIQWVYNNKLKIPGYYKIGGLVRFDRDTLLSWIKKNCTQPTPPSSRVSPFMEDKHGLMDS